MGNVGVGQHVSHSSPFEAGCVARREQKTGHCRKEKRYGDEEGHAAG
jgi:hypothetical protein